MIEDPKKTAIASLGRISQIAADTQDLKALWKPLLSEIIAVMEANAGSLMVLEGDFLILKE